MAIEIPKPTGSIWTTVVDLAKTWIIAKEQPPQTTVIKPSPLAGYMPWIIGGAVGIGLLLILTRR